MTVITGRGECQWGRRFAVRFPGRRAASPKPCYDRPAGFAVAQAPRSIPSYKGADTARPTGTVTERRRRRPGWAGSGPDVRGPAGQGSARTAGPYGTVRPPRTPACPCCPRWPRCWRPRRAAANPNRPAGSAALREAARAYWDRRGLHGGPEHIAAAPGTSPLVLALIAAHGGDVLVPRPCPASWIPQARLLGRPAYQVPTPAECGGVPDPYALLETVRRVRAEEAGRGCC